MSLWPKWFRQNFDSRGDSFAGDRTFFPHPYPKKTIFKMKKMTRLFLHNLRLKKLACKKFLSGEQLIKVNGDHIATQGQLAKILPLQHIDPQSTDIIDYGAKPRRQLIDWLMFHVEPDFYHAWQYYSRALKQRNSLLKSRRNLSLNDLEPWNKMLAEYGEMLHSQRSGIVEQWKVYFEQDLKQLLPNLEIQMEYVAGFHSELGLLHDLTVHHQKDLDRRYTEYGPHRADLRLKNNAG